MTKVAPVALIVFNRPDLTAEVFEAVRRARPDRLLICADGPRPDRYADVLRCGEVRSILERVDWPCDVQRRYSEQNLGCGPAVASGLDWVFTQVDRAIILEDDCVPDPTFFSYCTELLDRYADDTRVMQVAGSNLRAPAEAFGDDSYAFASFPVVWGWATWRRAWELYDRRMSGWPAFRDAGMVAGLPMGRRGQQLITRQLDHVHAGHGTWDHQWWYCVLSQHGLSAYPRTNLISNLGFRPDATQTVLAGDFANVPRAALARPVRHPDVVAENPILEHHLEKELLRSAGRFVELGRRLVPSHRVRRALARAIRRRQDTKPAALP